MKKASVSAFKELGRVVLRVSHLRVCKKAFRHFIQDLTAKIIIQQVSRYSTVLK